LSRNFQKKLLRAAACAIAFPRRSRVRRQLEDLGVKRISTGGALARGAWGGLMRATKDIAEHGRFDALADLPTMNAITAAIAKSE
jgi:2-methylisocitrate lyase-like PEP mutase family enzyme